MKSKKQFLMVFLLLVQVSIIQGCASYKEYTVENYDYGKIIDIKNQEIVIDFGHRESLRIGQIIDVYITIKASPGFTRRHKNIKMGVIEITEIIDDHHAKAKILYGKVDKECRVDL
jgi:hypothetical protein